MLKVFSIQKDIIDGYKSYLEANGDYSAYYTVFNKTIELQTEHLPALVFYSKSGEPESVTDRDTVGNHVRSFRLACRIFLPADFTTGLEEVADSIFNSAVSYANTNRNIKQIGNPSLTTLYDETDNVLATDLEIPIFFRTKYQ